MSKTRDTGFLGNVVKVDASGNVSFVSGSTTLATINTSGQLSGSSPVLSASYASNAELLDGLDSTVFTLTSSFNAQTASFNAFSASILTYTGSANNRFSSLETTSGSNITRLSALEAATGSLYSYTSSLNNKTASFATTGSNTFTGIQTVNSNLVVTGSITAQTLVVQTVTSSIIYSSGSNIFGNTIGNSQTFTGSMLITGSNALFNVGCVGIGTTSPVQSLTVNGNVAVGGQQAFWLRDDDGFSSNASRRAWAITANYSSFGMLSFFVANATASNPLGATAALNITSGGSVGIGNSNPQAKLQVSGNIIVGSDTCYNLISGPSTGAAIQLGTNSATFDRNLNLGFVAGDLTFSPIMTINAQTNNTCFVSSVCATNYISTNCYLFNYSQSTVRSIWGGGYGGVVQLTSDNATSARYARIGISDSTNVWQGGMTISGTDNSANFTGAGIFSDSISVAASTGGSSTFWGNLCVSNNKCAYFSGNVIALGTICTPKLYVNTPDGCGLTLQYGANSGYAGVSTDAANSLILKAYIGTEYMRITCTGVVGINDTNPTTSVGGPGLVVKGASYLQMSVKSTASSAGIEFIPSSGINYEIQANNGGSGCKFIIYDRTNNVYRLTIDSTGNIGFGTLTPTTTSGKGLHIYSNSGHANLALESCTSGVKWEILSTTSCNFVVYQAGGGGDRLTIAPNGITTFACRVCISIGRTNGADSTALVFQDNVTGVQTPGYGLRLAYQSNGTGVQSVIGLENGGTGTNNESQISFYTQNTAGGLGKRLLLTSVGDAGFSGNVCAACVNSYNGAITSNSVITYSVGGTMAGYSATSFDFPTWNDTDQGQMFEIKAFFDHFYNWNYGAHYYIYLTSRATNSQALTMFSCPTGNGGSWMAYKPNATTLRVCKIAGTYGGGGAFWIQVIAKQQ